MLLTLRPWLAAGGTRYMLARLGSASCRVLGSSVLSVKVAARVTRLAAPRSHQHLAAAAVAAATAGTPAKQEAAAQPLASMAANSPPAAEQRQRRKQQKESDPVRRRPALWWKDRPSYTCPACGQQCFKVPNFEAHILRCCPDVAPPEEWRAMLQAAEAQQATAQQQAEQQVAEQPQAEQAAEQQQQQDGQSPADGHQQGAAGSEENNAAQAQPRWKVHPADAAIRAWLEQAEQREAQQRRRAVSAVLASHAVPAHTGATWATRQLTVLPVGFAHQRITAASGTITAAGLLLSCLHLGPKLLMRLQRIATRAADRGGLPPTRCSGGAAAAGPARGGRCAGPAAAPCGGAAAGEASMFYQTANLPTPPAADVCGIAASPAQHWCGRRCDGPLSLHAHVCGLQVASSCCPCPCPPCHRWL